jgi:hypothetical protein
MRNGKQDEPSWPVPAAGQEGMNVLDGFVAQALQPRKNILGLGSHAPTAKELVEDRDRVRAVCEIMKEVQEDESSPQTGRPVRSCLRAAPQPFSRSYLARPSGQAHWRIWMSASGR